MTDVRTTSTPGVRGQTRSTWRDENTLRGLLLKLIRQHPDADRDELAELYVIEAQPREALVGEALRYKFDNDFNDIHRPARAQRRRAPTSDVSSLVNSIRATVLLDFRMPNGKLLRDSSGAECEQAGGWLVQVRARIGSDGIVGEHLGEAELAAMFASNGGQA